MLYRVSPAGSTPEDIAGMLAGGFRNCGRGAIADEIIAVMTAAGCGVRENGPFSKQPVMTLLSLETSP